MGATGAQGDRMCREMTKAGRDGTAPNLCILCGSDAELMGASSIRGDLFKCSSPWCGAEFKETSTVPELIECNFEVDAEYCIELPDGLSFDFVVTFKDECSVSILARKGMAITDILTLPHGETEYFNAPEGVSDHTEIRVYPYHQSAKPISKKEAI